MAFILLLVLLQVLASALFPVEIPQEILRLDGYLKDGVDILYFGDSTLAYPLGEITTGEILQGMLPDRAVGQVAHPAYGLDLYSRYAKYVVRSGRRPHTVIIPINMRSFSPEWDMRPSYQFEKEKKILAYGLLLSRIFLRPLEVLGVFKPEISQDMFQGTTVYDGDTPVGTVKDFESLADQDTIEKLRGDTGFAYQDTLPSEDDEQALQKALIYRYMYGLKKDHRKLGEMLKIAELERDVNVIFYITPVNYQQGERFLGSAFSERFAENVDLVKSLLATKSVTVLDLGFDLEAYAFADMEHLREVGKTYVAEQLAMVIQPELFIASSDTDLKLTPTIPSPEPTVVAPTPTVAAAPLTVTVPLPSATLRPPIPTTVRTPEPVGPMLAPTEPSPTRAADNGVSSGTVVSASHLAYLESQGEYPVDMYRLRYRTLNEDDQLEEIQADIYVPRVETSTTFPVLVYAPGTTGLTNMCAPLIEQAKDRDWGNYFAHTVAYAAQGYIVVLPNGLGFRDPDRTHPYFVAELQAHVLLDAARAAYSFLDSAPAGDVLARADDAVFFMGYSSGGHAAFAAKDFAVTYAPDLSVKGVIGHGPTTNVEALLRDDPVFSPYIIHAYRDFYGSGVIRPADVFLPKWVPTFDMDVLTKCVDDIFLYYSRGARDMYSPEFRSILYNGRLADVFPLFAEKLEENRTGVAGGRHIPVLILQGTGDTVVTLPSQKEFVGELCAFGNNVTYLEYPAVPHAAIRWTSFGDTLWWMQRIAQGDTFISDCVDAISR